MTDKKQSPTRTSTRPARRRGGRPRNADVAAKIGEVIDLPDGPVDVYGLTPRQRHILILIRDSVAHRGYPPSMRELGEAAGLASSSSVSYQLRALETRGFIRRDPNKPRAMEVLLPDLPPLSLPGLHAPENVENVDEPDINHSVAQSVSVPLLGRIAAGNPILAEERVEDILALPKQIVGEGKLFMLEVKGESMIEAAICDGDFVVVRQQPDAVNGDIVAALLDDEATVKTFKRKDGHVWLLPHNPAFQPINGDEARILGKVVAVLRRI